MAKPSVFLLRVELKHPDTNCYPDLHEALAKIDFLQTIVSDKGVEYDLPDAMYCRKCEYDRQELFKVVKAAIRTVTKNYAAILSGNGGATWTGMDETEVNHDDQ